MSVLSYLMERASNAVLSGDEQISIINSISTLANRLNSYFETAQGNGISGHFRFGSSTRGTILPRRFDEHSDVDYLIVFENDNRTPQTYLDRLKRFAEARYGSSEIYQSSPTIVLELNHIKFELVPALHSWGDEYQIPLNANEWQSTNPKHFTQQLELKNNAEAYLMKPTIRLVKIWNAANGYVFNSFLLEKWISEQSYLFCSNQKNYLFNVFDLLHVNSPVQWKIDKVNRAKEIIAKVREYEATDMPFSAELEVKKLIP